VRDPAATSRPVIAVFDHDGASRATFARELDGRYGRDYDVVVEESGEALLARLADLERGGRDVVLVLADNASGGAQVLAAARPLHPHAKRGLVLGWNENRSRREEINRALARGDADYFVGKPMASPDERFHRAITEFLDDWWRVHGQQFDVVTVVGDARSARAHEICDLLQRHDVPYRQYFAGTEDAQEAFAQAGLAPTTQPVVIVRGAKPLVDPSNVEVADALGAQTEGGGGVYDVVVIGAGPAGLAASVYAGSEGLRTALVERTAMGGQAGTSSMIRNYLGFPRGISGAELATQALSQAILFGTEIVYGGDVVGLRTDGGLHEVRLADGATVDARAVVIATGVAYRKLDVPSLEPFQGIGVFYGAAMSEARNLAGERACVVGGGNSAGQAAMHLAQFAEQVTILVRSGTLASSMSDYLVTAIERTPNIEVRFDTEVVGGGGDGHLVWVELRDRSTGAVEQVPAAGLFVLIGADPCTDWLPPTISRDAWGYVETGAHCEGASCGPDTDGCEPVPAVGRTPLMFETTMPGVFAVGDVRHGSVKRVASAVGEGSVCVRLIHEYLGDSGTSA
jgi:thioredoxin reductase (NADPH)